MSPRTSVRPWFLWFIVIAVPVLAFVPAIAGGWIYDDLPLIADNRYAQSFSWWSRWFTHDFWNVPEEAIHLSGRLMYWRPAVSATYAMDWTLSGGAPLWFHITNLIGHALVAALAYRVLRRWLGGSTIPALVATLLFAVHPTKAESVAWIAGRTDVICMFALLVATTGVAARLRGVRWGIALEVAGTVLAYLSKEQAIILPAFVMIETWVAADRPPLDLQLVRRALRAATPQLAVAVVYLTARSLLMPMGGGGAGPAPLHHLASVIESFGYFFSFSVAPHDLSVQQGLVYTVNGELHHSTFHIVVGALGLVVLLSIALACRRRVPGVTLGIAFYLATLLPTSNIIYTGLQTLVSERFLYVPSLGLALAVGSALVHLRGRPRALATGLLLALSLLACAASMRRSADYGDEHRFWTRELAMHPTSSDVRQYFAARAMREKQYERALLANLDFLRAFTDRDLPMKERIDTAANVATVLASLVPDLDTVSLRKIDDFVAAMLAADQPQAVLDLRGVRLEISPSSKPYKRELGAFRPRLLAFRADLANRLGETARAKALVANARQECATCSATIKAEVLALALAGQYEDAIAAVEKLAARTTDPSNALLRKHIEEARAHRDASLSATGPVAIREHALMYAALEQWGAAYRVLEPHKDEIARVRAVALGYAELAFRAGKPEEATRMLSLHVPADELQPLLADWAAKMGWR